MSTSDEPQHIELLQGTLDLLILRTLVLGPAHGNAIVKANERESEDVLRVEQGSLYLARHRLIQRGWISFEAGISQNNRRANCYRLTDKGRRQLNIETAQWKKLAGAVAGILRTAAQESKR
jgi:transcriptional regulator